jgi:hypothetical protein
MAVTPESFRLDHNEFKDPNIYSDHDIDFNIGIAGKLLNVCRWDDLLDAGTALFVAHFLVLGARAKKTSAAGGIPGAPVGMLTSKSVDKVAAGYDIDSVKMEDGAFWNMTTYGIRFLQLSRMIGAGGVQVGAGFAGGQSGAWPGFIRH